jgi:hypothetical protein
LLGWASAGNDPTGAQSVGFGFPTSGLVTVDGSSFGSASASLGLTKLVGGPSFSASYPMWKRNGTAWNARLGDDSADAAITAGATTLSGALTYGGVTLSNSVTGTGSMVLSTSPTFTGTPVGTTAAQATNSTALASTAYVDRVAVQQVVSTITGAVATGTTSIPLDDTIPQNTEGDQYMTLAITPKSATSKLVIQVIWNGSNNTNGVVSGVVALFQDSTANAIAAEYFTLAGQYYGMNIPLTWVMTSGTTSSTTFKVRVGCQSGTTTFNGTNGTRLFGGVQSSSITITEYFV